MKAKSAKILLVEDDHFILSMYSAKFVSEGFSVRGAMTAVEALEEAKAFKPDIILLDIMLPDEDGFAVLKALKRGKTTAAIPVVLLSNLSDPSHREQGLIGGAEDYWIKAYLDPSEVVAKTKQLLKA
jgi:DNA-binding response OmpR family regulator